MISICTPTRDRVEGYFAYDLVRLIQSTPNAVFTVAQGSLLSNLRTLLVRTSLEKGVHYILFIDSDMRFPPDTAKRLLEDDKDIVGANCQSRTFQGVTAKLGGKYIDPRSPDQKLQEVDSIGFGVTMIKAEVFKKLSEPWFAMPWALDERKHVGEDVYFCKIARDAGFHVWVDHELSKEVKHIGSIELEIK